MKVLTWNLWFDSHLRPQRMQHFLDFVAHQQPDLLALQECTLAVLRLLVGQGPLASYHCSTALEAPPASHGTVIFSRRRPLSFENLLLPGAMGRHACLADDSDYQVACVHLESLNNGPIRAQQMATLCTRLRAQPTRPALLLGDFNFCATSSENDCIPADFRDAWNERHPGRPGWSIDSDVNSYLRPPKHERIDRILLYGQSWKVHDIELVNHGVSDHLGLLAELQLQ